MMERAEQYRGHPARLEDLLRLGRRAQRERLVPRHRHRAWRSSSRSRNGQPASTRRSRRWSPPTRASRCPASTSAPRRRATSARPRASTRTCNFLVYHSGYDIGDTQGPYRGRRRAPTRTRNTVDALIKSLRENNWDASHVRQEGQGVRQRARTSTPSSGSVWRSVMNDPDQAAHLLGKLITHVGPEADRVGHRQPLVRLAAGRDRRPCAASSSPSEGKELYGLPYGLEGDVEDPTQQGAAARRARSATGSSAATRRAPTGSTRTRARNAISLRRRSTACASTAT